jgi:hypothetical protein
VDGEKYFDCPPKHGIFVRPEHIAPVSAHWRFLGEPIDKQHHAVETTLYPQLALLID